MRLEREEERIAPWLLEELVRLVLKRCDGLKSKTYKFVRFHGVIVIWLSHLVPRFSWGLSGGRLQLGATEVLTMSSTTYLGRYIN